MIRSRSIGGGRSLGGRSLGRSASGAGIGGGAFIEETLALRDGLTDILLRAGNANNPIILGHQ